MTQIFTKLIMLACPLGMASMMLLPALGRRLTRRTTSTTSTTSTTPGS